MTDAYAPQVVPRLAVALRHFARFSGLATVFVAAAALVGWSLDIELLKTVVPGHAVMKANTAMGLLLSGVALVASLSERPGAGAVSAGLSVAVLLLGCTVLLEYGSGIATGLDTLLFDDPAARAEGSVPGRISQISALSFVLLGWRGLEARSMSRVWVGQALALGLVVIGLFALSAYGYAMGTGTREAPFNPISVHTAVLLLLMGLGWLASRPEQGLIRVLSADSFGGELARRTLLPALLIPALLSYLAQLLRAADLLSEGATITLLAVSSGAAVATMIWWASALLDRVERQRRRADQLRDSALTDALTGLGNRRSFDGALARLLQRRSDEGATFSLLLIDLDHFKTYNDSFGHLAGDEALRQTGRLLPLALRPGDIATRYGGEEFAVLLPGTRREHALGVAERIVDDIRCSEWPFRAVTASVGVAESMPGESAGTLVARADAALYAAKQAGRDRALAAPPQSGE